MSEGMKEEEDKHNFGSTPMFEQLNLYCLTFESFSPLESSILPLARPDSASQPREVKRAIVSLVASAIALIDICNMFRDMEYANLDTRIESPVSLGGEGGCDEPPSSVSGCLPHSNSPQKIDSFYTPSQCPECPRTYKHTHSISNSPQKISNYSEIGKRIHTMLSSLSRIELSEEEWLDSYELHVNNRKSKNPLSDRHVRF